MKVFLTLLATILVLCVIPIVVGSSCSTEPLLTGSVDDLSAAQKEALVAAAKSAESVGQASHVAYYTADGVAAEGSGKSRYRDLTIGNCPAVTVETRTGGQLGSGFTVGIDFGDDPCHIPFSYVVTGTSYACSGSASGSLSLIDRLLNLTFTNLTCNGETIDGTLDATASLDPIVSLSGDWNLTYTSTEDNYSLGTAGSGEATYSWVDGCCDVTAVPTFTGTLSETKDGETYDWSLIMGNIQISLEQYVSLMPYSGYATVTGPDIVQITVEFSENSPVTGEVTVTIPNPDGPGALTFTVELFTLVEWLDATMTAAGV